MPPCVRFPADDRPVTGRLADTLAADCRPGEAGVECQTTFHLEVSS